MKRIMMHFLGLISLLIFCSSSWAAPIQWSGNNHWYEAIYVPSKIKWTDAKIAAETAGGYLATATSQSENTFIFSLIDDPKFWFMDGADNNEGPCMGGYYVGPEGTMSTHNWKWVTGETWSYANWDNGEPNFPGEKRMNFFSNDASSRNPIRQPYWNNISDNGSVLGYIVEWNTNPVPIPGAVWLLGSGLIGLVALRRKRGSR